MVRRGPLLPDGDTDVMGADGAWDLGADTRAEADVELDLPRT